MEASIVSRMKELEEENRRLKKMYAEVQMSTDILKEALGKNGWSAQFASGFPEKCGSSVCLSVSGLFVEHQLLATMEIRARLA